MKSVEGLSYNLWGFFVFEDNCYFLQLLIADE